VQTWQRNARLSVVVVAVVVSAAVYLTGRRREPPPTPPSIARLDPAAVIESSGAFVRDVKGEKERFRVEAGQQLTYADGRTKLMHVKISVDRSGKTFVIVGNEAEVGDNQSSVVLKGQVHLTGSDGLTMNAEGASYSEGEGIVRAPGPVTFSRGTMTGKGVDFTYDRDRDTIGLADQTFITVAPDKKDTAGADIRAGAALLARKDGFMSFEREVHIIRGDQIIDAARAVADLTKDEKHITALDVNGAARIENAKATSGGVRTMAASNIKLAYAENTELVQRAVLAGGSTVKIAGEGDAALDKTLGADSLEIGLGPDGSTVTSLTARDKVSLDLPAPSAQASKRIRSESLAASGDDKKGLTAAVFTDAVEYREFGGTPVVERLIRSRSLDAVLKNGFAEISDARFTGNVQFADGDMHAAAGDVRYKVGVGSVDLTGKLGNALPHVSNNQIIIDSGHIEMVLEGPKLTATEGPVRAVLRAAKPGTGKDATRMPGLMQQDRDVNGSSDTLVYDGAHGSLAEFTGNARLFQGETLIQGQKVAIEGRTGNLRADGAVRSTVFVNDIDPDTNKPKPTLSAASGGAMQYDEATRRMSYETAAHMVSPQGDITAGKIDITFAPDSQDVKTLDAAGTVTLKENGRVTTGDKLLYVAEGEAYTMSGKLVRMLEANCRESTGTRLAFDKSTDNLRIEGNDDSRTKSSKSAPGCVPRTD
jgi:lipopolysaccharide export system protein LptA